MLVQIPDSGFIDVTRQLGASCDAIPTGWHHDRTQNAVHEPEGERGAVMETFDEPRLVRPVLHGNNGC